MVPVLLWVWRRKFSENGRGQETRQTETYVNHIYISPLTEEDIKKLNCVLPKC